MGKHYSAREMLARLVAFPTVSRDSNLEMIGFVRDYLREHGVESRLVMNADATKANLYAQIGPEVPGGVVLSGHTDVVPTDGQTWSSDPFSLTEREGRLHGRGACDMKGFLAAGLSLVPQMRAAALGRPIQFALSYDEEVGCQGVPSLIQAIRADLPPAAAVIVGEPTNMEVVTSHKGGVGLWTQVTGHPVHSSQMQLGVSAIMVAARLVDWHSARMAETRAAAERAAPGAPRFRFTPPYTTLHVGLIRGGTAPNITAERCRFSTDIRHLPEEDGADWLARYRAFCAGIEAEMRAVHPGCAIAIEERFRNPGVRQEPPEAAEAETLARRLTGDNGEHAVSYGTEASFFQRAGYSVVVCGPGDIEQAHQADEFVTAAQLDAATAFHHRLITELSS